MRKIKWISQEISVYKTENFLNLYSNYMINESLKITSVDKYSVLITFTLTQTFNNQDELDEVLGFKEI